MTSDHRERSNRRRDVRKAREHVRPPGGSKKNTKRWCRGKVGVTHKPVCVDYSQYKGISMRVHLGWKILLCSECKRELQYWFPWRAREKKPDWVTDDDNGGI